MDGEMVIDPDLRLRIWFFAFVIAWVVFLLFGLYIADQKRRPGAEAVLFTLFLGPLGLVLLALLPTLVVPAAKVTAAEPTPEPEPAKPPIKEEYVHRFRELRTEEP